MERKKVKAYQVDYNDPYDLDDIIENNPRIILVEENRRYRHGVNIDGLDDYDTIDDLLKYLNSRDDGAWRYVERYGYSQGDYVVALYDINRSCETEAQHYADIYNNCYTQYIIDNCLYTITDSEYTDNATLIGMLSSRSGMDVESIMMIQGYRQVPIYEEVYA